MLRTDEHIKKDIVENFFWNNRVDASDIKIKVTAGEVTLRGFCGNIGKQFRKRLQLA